MNTRSPGCVADRCGQPAERPSASDDSYRPSNRGDAQSSSEVPTRRTARGRSELDGVRSVRGHSYRRAGVTRQLRSNLGAIGKQGRRSATDIAWASPHRRHGHDPPRLRPRRDPSNRRHSIQSPDMLMKTYAHARPESVRTVTDKIGQRTTRTS